MFAAIMLGIACAANTPMHMTKVANAPNQTKFTPTRCNKTESPPFFQICNAMIG
jgi:hypothetical protein